MLTDEDGNVGSADVQQPHQPATDATKAEASLREQLGRFGATVFAVHDIALQLSQPWFVPASVLNALRRDAVADLEANRARNFARLPRATPVEPLCPTLRTRSPSWAMCSTIRPTTFTCATA